MTDMRRPELKKMCFTCGSYGFKTGPYRSLAYCYYHEKHVIILPWSEAQTKQPIGERHCQEWDQDREKSVKKTDVFNKACDNIEETMRKEDECLPKKSR